ncbi:MAG: PAS domain S-box protein [Rhodospirillales bacterium]|nr:PAS domain S-box protein [Rhodospirillales bacterium]
MASRTIHKLRPALRRQTIALAITLAVFTTAIICGTNFVLYRAAVQEYAASQNDPGTQGIQTPQPRIASDDQTSAVPLDTIRAPYLRAALSQSLFALAGLLGGILLLVRTNRSLTEELETSVSRLSTAQRIGKMGNWDMDVSTQKLWWSDEIYRMLGFETGQVKDLFQTFVNCIHPEDRDRVMATVRRSVENLEPYNIRHRSVRADGSEIMVLEQGEVVLDGAGNPAHLIGTAQDVTEQWIAEQELDRLHTEQELIFDNSAIGVSFLKGGTIVRSNAFYDELFGYTPGTIVGMDSNVFFPDEASAKEAWEEAAPILKRGEISNATRLMRRRNGDLFWCRITGKLVDSDDEEQLSIWLLEDISDRKQAEEALRLSEDRYKLAISGVRDGAWDINLVTGEVWLSPAWKELTGLGDEDLAGYDWRGKIHPDDLPALEKSIAISSKGNSPHFWHEVRHQHKDGRWLWFECRGNVKMGENGRAIRFSGRVTDITRRKQAEDSLKQAYAEMEARIATRTEELSHELAERKRAEEALAASESRLKTLAELSPVGLLKAGQDGKVTFVNDSFSEILGLGRDDVMAFGWENALHPDDKERVDKEWRDATARGVPYKSEFRITAHSDGERWVYGQAIPELGADGKVTGYVGTVTDITDRKRVENLVKRSEEKLRMILDNAADGIITIDARGRIQSFNAAAETLFGYQLSEVLGQNVSMLMPEPYRSEHDRYLGTYLSTGVGKIIGDGRNVTGVRKDGTEFPLYLAVSAPASKDISIFTGIVRDMTAVVAIEEELREAKEQAETANHAKSDFLSRMSHELRTPMNAILGFSQLLELNNGEPLAPGQREFVEQILASGHHLLALINEILDLSKIEAGGLAIDMEDVAPAQVVQESLSLIAPAAEARGICLINRFEGADVPPVRAGVTRLKQVMTNLLSNAVKYNMDNGSVTVDYRIVDGNYLRLSVCDTGSGIAEENQTKLFEPFVRLESDSSGIEGTGIGLAITQNLVNLMGGKIYVDSAPGKGCTFSIDLRLAGAAGARPDAATPNTQPPEVAAGA